MSKFSEEYVRHLMRFDLLGMLSPLERKQLDEWLDEQEAHKELYRKIRNGFEAGEIRNYLQTDTEKAWKKVKNTVSVPSVGHTAVGLKWLKYAAVVLPVVLSLSLWYVWEGANREDGTELVLTSGRPLPVLTLDNGETRYLQPEEQAEIEVNEGVKAYQANGGLVYDTVPKSGETRYNRIQVPKGSEYQVVLADGTKVWLNAASELRYPVSFPSGERRVFLRGEAFFEVAFDGERPFYVETGEVDVRVLGTVFDVNTHYTYGVRTVLVDGAVTLDCGGQRNIRLNPGELADFNRTTSEVSLKQVDVRPYVAWKDGFFVFEEETLEEIMNTLALWYDKEVFFLDRKNKDLHFSGHLKRYDRIETILTAINDVTGVEFQMNEKVILIR